MRRGVLNEPPALSTSHTSRPISGCSTSACVKTTFATPAGPTDKDGSLSGPAAVPATSGAEKFAVRTKLAPITTTPRSPSAALAMKMLPPPSSSIARRPEDSESSVTSRSCHEAAHSSSLRADAAAEDAEDEERADGDAGKVRRETHDQSSFGRRSVPAMADGSPRTCGLRVRRASRIGVTPGRPGYAEFGR